MKKKKFNRKLDSFEIFAVCVLVVSSIMLLYNLFIMFFGGK